MARPGMRLTEEQKKARVRLGVRLNSQGLRLILGMLYFMTDLP